MIEKLEAEKKAQAQNKKFKEAKRTKDLINLKQSKKLKVQEEIEDFKKCIEAAEENLDKAKRTLNKLNEKKEVAEKELEEVELKILELLQNEQKQLKAGVSLLEVEQEPQTCQETPATTLTEEIKVGEQETESAQVDENEIGEQE
jgi:uncharacterized UPF0160 family protein